VLEAAGCALLIACWLSYRHRRRLRRLERSVSPAWLEQHARSPQP
jgi:hypothetical protein